MSDQKLIEISHEAIRSFSDADWSAARKIHAENIVYVEKPTGKTTTGYEAFESMCHEWKALMSNCSGTIGDTYVSGDWVVVEVVWSGTQSGPLKTPMGEIPASGKSMSNPGVQLQRIENGQVAEIRNYFDMLVILSEFGALGSP